jgi:hypothetical protein
LSPSDFHDARPEGLQDYWPGEFSETWLYAPDKSPAGVLKALRAGTFFGEHGKIVRQVELLVDAAGLPRPAMAGECIEVPSGAQVRARLRFQATAHDWTGERNRIDTVELITVTASHAKIETVGNVSSEGAALTKTLEVPAGGLALRARGRHGDLMFYTNAVRVKVAAVDESAPADGGRTPLAFVDRSAANWQTLLLLALALLAALTMVIFVWRRRRTAQ